MKSVEIIIGWDANGSPVYEINGVELHDLANVYDDDLVHHNFD